MKPDHELPPVQQLAARRLASFFRRWQLLQKDKGLPYSQAEAAAKMGFGQSALSQYLRGEIPLNVKVLQKFCELLNVPPREISAPLANEMRKIADVVEPNQSGISEFEADAELDLGKALGIPYFAPKGSCQNGDVRFAEPLIGHVAKEDAFFAKYGVPATEIIAVVAEDDSNADFIVSGDICFFDRRTTEPRSGHIYLVEHPDGLVIRLLRRRIDGSWALETKNADKVKFPDELIPASTAGLLRTCGQFFYRQGG